MYSHPCSIDAPVAEVGVNGLPFGKVTRVSSPATALTQNVENRVKDFPHINFTGTTTRIRLWNHVPKQFKLVLREVAGISFTYVALSVLWNVYLQLTLSELFYYSTDFSNTLLEYLREYVVAKNQDKWQELVGYLEKHQPEIINYNRRIRAGKTIGSGRVEKGVDLTVGSRQKHKGMSWRTKVVEPYVYSRCLTTEKFTACLDSSGLHFG